MKEILKRIIKEFYFSELPDVKKRGINLHLTIEKIISIVGPRRSGKTYLMFQIMKEIIEKYKINKKRILYINFEDERLFLEEFNYDDIFIAYKELYPDIQENEIFIFFDEIQNLKNWEKFLRRIYDTKTKHIFITGSNSKILSKEIATSLRGRTITIETLPLSFKEYLFFKKIDIDFYTTSGIAILNKEFEEYLYWGGYPELINYNHTVKLKILQEYFNVMIYRDLIERYNIKEVYILKYLIKRLFSAFTKEYSVNKIYNELKSRKFAIGKDKLYEYMEYLIDNYIIGIVEKYEPSVIKQELSNKKVYLYDNGLFTANSILIEENKGKLLENLIFIELYRRNKKVFFFKNSYECDFFISDNNKLIPIQVTFLLNENNEKRELEGLIKIMERFNIEEGILITYNNEKEVIIKNKKITIISAIKWLLNT